MYLNHPETITCPQSVARLSSKRLGTIAAHLKLISSVKLTQSVAELLFFFKHQVSQLVTASAHATLVCQYNSM